MSGRDASGGDLVESACGCAGPSGEAEEPVTRVWQVREVQLGLASGVLLLGALLEHVGTEKAVRLGPLDAWQAAVAQRQAASGAFKESP